MADDTVPHPPLTRADARALGIDRATLEGTAFRPVHYDSFVPADVETSPVLLALAALAHCSSRAAASHHTAATYWGLWVPPDPDIHVAGPKNAYLTKTVGVRRHLHSPDAEVVRRGSLRLSSPIQCVLDLAKWLPLVDLVALCDSVLHKGYAEPAELIARADSWRGHGSRKARRAARLARVGVESPMETRLRLLIVLAGLPEPVVNHILYREDGTWWIRFDLSYPWVRIAFEYDGRQHAQDTDQWRHDITRREVADHLDWRMVVVIAEGIWNEPDRTLGRIVAVLTDRGVHVGGIDEEWRRHFPIRRSAA